MADETNYDYDSLSNMLDPAIDVEDSNIDFNALGQAIDTTWGRSSTPHTAQQSVKFSMRGANHLVASYVVIVRFASERQMIETKRTYKDESVRIINANVSAIKKRYKNLTGDTLKVKEISTSDSLEVISTTFHNPTRQAYVRRETLFEIS